MFTKDELQEHCDQIIESLENAVQAYAFALHIKNSIRDDCDKAAKASIRAKEHYFNIVSALYGLKTLPSVYKEVYESAISKPCGYSYERNPKDGSNVIKHSYAIAADRIVYRLNKDFNKQMSRDFWVSYKKQHLDFGGATSIHAIGAPNYIFRKLDDSQTALKEKTVYWNIKHDGLHYVVLDVNNEVKRGIITRKDVLCCSLGEEERVGELESEPVYAEVTVADGKITLNNLFPFSEIKEEDQDLDLQEQSTMIIDRLIDAVYAELYKKYLPAEAEELTRTEARVNASERYAFYLAALEKLYAPKPVPTLFNDVYQKAIRHATFKILTQLYRHPIYIGDVLSQLNYDFVLNNPERGLQWLVYNKPYLGFFGQTITEPMPTGVYQIINICENTDGLSYKVFNPQRVLQRGYLPWDSLLGLISDKVQLDLPETRLYVEVNELTEAPLSRIYAFILLVLAQPMTQTIALTLLLAGVALALSGVATGIGTGTALCGVGVLMARFFAQKKACADTLTPDFFAPVIEQESQLVMTTV